MAKADLVVVTAASQSYLGLLKGLLGSLEAARSGDAPRFDIKVIDIGLDARARNEIAARCDVAAPGIDIGVVRSDHPRPYLMSRAVRPFIPDLYPGYRVYLWMDADAWVQAGGALTLLDLGARRAGMAAVPELDRAYACLYHKKSYHYLQNHRHMADSFGKRVADAYSYLPVINSGVFAAEARSPLWAAWRRHLAETFRRARRVRDQPAFNLAIYRDQIPIHTLPSVCNWLCCHALPWVDQENRCLTEPGLPHQALGIVHLTETLVRRRFELTCSDGRKRMLGLDYPSLRALWGDPESAATR